MLDKNHLFINNFLSIIDNNNKLMSSIKPASKSRNKAKSTREDWINTALDTLITEGEEKVKVSLLSEKLKCARSSFYWFFNSRADLLDNLLEHWQQTNTAALIAAAKKPAASINMGLTNLYYCWTTKGEFNTQLDFAIRDWARRSGTVRRAVDVSDNQRIEAITDMFVGFGYDSDEADVRARSIYFTQIGYDALDQRETRQQRIHRGRHYLYCMTGQKPTQQELDYLSQQLLLDR